MPHAATSDDEREIVTRNRRARHEYHVIETWEAGIVLTGTEVKSLRHGQANLTDAFGVVNGNEVFLLNLHISPYEQGNRYNHEPSRTRKLLLNRREIRRLIGAVERQGLTLVPLDIYFRHGIAKVTLALAKGKKMHDKREDARRREDERDMARAVRAR